MERILPITWLVLMMTWGLSGAPGAMAQQADAPSATDPPASESAAPEADPAPEAAEAKPEAESEKAEQAPADEDEASAGEPAADGSPERAEQTGASDQPAVEWNDEIAAVLEKRYPQNVQDLKIIQTQLSRVIDHAVPATVAVQVGGAFGSGVIVSPDGIVLTAGHVVGRPGQKVRFIFADGKTAEGETLGMYREIDSGMMRITDPGPWPHVEMAEAGDLKAGQWVTAIGQPGGFDQKRTPPVRLGRVLFSNEDVISTDCTLVGGDSGGPLFNMRGQVVGIHSRIGRRITDNFHVPVSTYHETWDRLVAGERWGGRLVSDERVEARPLLGVAGDRYAEACELTQVFPGMPADRAGLKVGDIVRTFNGESVETIADLTRLVYDREPGDRVKLEVLRGEETIEVELRLGGVRRALPGSPDLPNRENQDREE